MIKMASSEDGSPPVLPSSPSFYDVLGLPRNSTNAEIRNAYKKLAMKWHPDKYSGEPFSAEEAKSKFQAIQQAYAVLSDEDKRAMYDAGVYDPEDDVNGFSDFLDEMASMMASMRERNDRVESMFELQQTFEKVVQENRFFTKENEESNPPAPKTNGAMHDQNLLTRMDDIVYEQTYLEDWDVEDWDQYDDDYDDNAAIFEDTACHIAKRSAEAELTANGNDKRPKVCS